MSHVFGPVPSRRLGFSLGVDLIPPKTCTYDCLYCQVGKTTAKTVEPFSGTPVEQVAAEIGKKLARSAPDAITLAGSGEPTLCAEMGRLIRLVKKTTSVGIALLTNGSLFWKEAVREGALEADLILPTLTTAVEETFRRIHRPHDSLTLRQVVQGLKELRRAYKGGLFLEVVLLSGINDNERELEALRRTVVEVSPDKIQLNTVVRPPADGRATAVDRARLEQIKRFFGESAEIVAERPLRGDVKEKGPFSVAVQDMIKRRPLTAADAAKATGASVEEVEDVLKGLVLKGLIRKRDHSGETYYLSHENEEDR